MTHPLAGLGLLLAALLPPANSQQGPLPDLQPYQCSSASGRWVLSIDPSRRDGGGPGAYRCIHDGKEVWSGQKPWTLQSATITDAGYVGGYSYSEGGLSQFAEGRIHLVILAPDGTVRLDEAHARESSHFFHVPPNPRCDGLVLHPDLDRFVFRIADPDVNRGREEWWCYDIPKASQTLKKRPRDLLPEKDASDWILAARGVSGTSFTIVQWRTFDWPKLGLQFALIDSELKPLWCSSLPEELTLEDDDDSDRLRDEVYEGGTILKEDEPRRFSVGLPKSRVRIRYAIETPGSEVQVRELSREPWSLPSEARSVARYEQLPLTRLVHRESHALEAGAPSTSPVHDVVAFDVPKPDRLRVVCEEVKGKAFTFLQVDLAGTALTQQRIELTDRLPESDLDFWPFGSRRWIASESPYGVDKRARLRLIDEDHGTVAPLDILDCPSVEDVAALDDDRFVVLVNDRREFTSSAGVRAYHRDGRLLWKIDQDYDSEKSSSLFSPEALAVTSEGNIAVVDVIRHVVQVFGSEGRFLSLVDLESSWGTEPRYPSGVRADSRGGILVHDFNGDPALYRMDVAGTVRSKLSPRFPDGKVADGLTRHVRVAPDGRLWARDDQRLLRMDDRGVVDLQIGVEANVDVLSEPSAAAIDVFGRALVQDKATGAVHVFDGKGKKLFTCRPEPTDFTDASSIAHLAATPERGIVAEADRDTFVQFGPDGTRERMVTVEGRGMNLVFSPAGEAYAGRFDAGFVALDEGLRPGTAFDRAPDGSWLQGADEPAVAPDGAVAVVDSVRMQISERGISLVIFEKPDPKASRSIELPEGTPNYCLSLGRTWAVVAGFGSGGLLVHRVDGRKLRFAVPGVEEGTSCRFGFDPESDELLALDTSARKLHRFALP